MNAPRQRHESLRRGIVAWPDVRVCGAADNPDRANARVPSSPHDQVGTMTTQEFAFWTNAYNAAIAASAEEPRAVADKALDDYRLNDPMPHAHDRGYEEKQKSVSDAPPPAEIDPQ